MALKTTTLKHHTKTKAAERRPKEETVRMGREIYERDIRHLVEVGHEGKTVSIDVDSGFWAMGHDRRDARERLWKKRPQAFNLFSERIGYKAIIRTRLAYQRRTG